MALLAGAGIVALLAPVSESDTSEERVTLQGRDCPAGSKEARAPKFSAESGFHEAPFELSLTSAQDETIYFTLDGSCPDVAGNRENTFVYEQPIPISDRTGSAPSIASIEATVGDRTPYFAARQDRFAMPDLGEVPLEQATVVRARTARSKVSTATYFVGTDRVRERLPVLSLVTDPEHLFGHEAGIYVAGRELDEWLQSEDFDPDARWRIPTNYHQRGREWERPALLTFCKPGGECIKRRKVGLRMHGRFSRNFPQKSMRLYARNIYGDRRFRNSLFVDDPGIPTGHRRLILRNSGNDNALTMLADAFLQSLMGGLHADTQGYQPVVVFLNGKYWGIYNIRERYDRHYIAVVHGADPNKIDFLNNSGARNGLPPDLMAKWWGWIAKLSTLDATSDAFVAQVDATIDVDSFFDFIIAHVFVGNRDWVSNNVRWWREPGGPHAIGEGPRDGRWRWLISDFDQWGQGRQGRADFDNFADRLAPPDDPYYRHGFPFLFHRVVENDALRARFLNRFADLLNTSFHPRVTVPKLEEAAGRIAEEIPRHAMRWQAPSIAQWQAELARMAEFLEARPDYQRQHLVNLFALNGVANLTVLNDPGIGSVKVNSVEIAVEDFADKGEWTGVYFQGTSITVEAIPAEGYRFIGWDGDESGHSPTTVEIDIRDQDVVLRPRFEPA